MQLIIHYLIFPGLLFILFAGGWGWWLERKLSARFHFRIGPPWFQNFVDIIKLFLKEPLVPAGANVPLFVASPLIAFASALIASLIITMSVFTGTGFLGDLFVILYFLIIPSLFIALGAFASNNPMATVGGAREMKLILSYEFVFITALLIVIIKSHGLFSLAKVVSVQSAGGSTVFSVSGFIGAVLCFIYTLAKLGIVPFDASEAEQEIMGGAFIEYSGPLLGLFKLTKALLFFSLPLFLISLFAGASLGLHIIYKYLIVVLLIAVVKNTNPRLRINDIVQIFWFVLFPLGCAGIALALLGW